MIARLSSMPSNGPFGTLRAFRDELVDLADRIAQSVVTVRLDTAAFNGGIGSGWFVQSGVIVTNHHVIAGERPSAKVRLRGGRVVPAEIVGSDPRTDLALLRCAVRDVAPLPMQASPVRIGELCFAFGSPLGEYTESVTFGVVSGLGRRMPLKNGLSIEDLVQTDAEINPGNSGGPLVDLDGEVLGVNVMIRADARGLGFAVPARTVSTVVPELLEHGDVLRPRLGVTLEVVEYWDQGVKGERLQVVNAPEGHPLQRGDRLLTLAGVPITKRADLFDVMRRNLLDQLTPVEVEREGRRQSVSIRPTL